MPTKSDSVGKTGRRNDLGNVLLSFHLCNSLLIRYQNSTAALSILAAEGRGKLIDRHTVEVELSEGGTKRMTGKTILLALGGKPSKIDIPGSVRKHPQIGLVLGWFSGSPWLLRETP